MSDMTPFLRDAALSDAAAILPIFNQAVMETTAVWSDKLSDLTEREEWIRTRIAQRLPVIVCEIDNRVVGYASLSDFRTLDGYRYTKETSVFVETTQHRRGIGRALVMSLLQKAHQIDAHAIVAAIDANNAASIALHESLGFREAGRLRQLGRKFDSWLDLIYMQILL
jgi:phosphinothricin acetyltransferase